MKRKHVLGMVLTAVMCASMSMGALAEEDFHLELKLSHVFAPNEQLTITMEEICNNIRERTDGAIDIQHFPQGQLATYKDGLEQVVRGANFISVEDPSYLGDYVPDFNVLAGPMLVTSYDQYEYLLESDEVKGMMAAAEEKGIKILNLDYIFGFRSMMTNKLIEKPEDLKGMKIRTPGSELYVNTINYMGATATPMAFSETISAVQQGVVDGLEGTIDAYATNGSAEVAKQMALTKHLLGVCGAYINIDVWNSIPEEYQTIMQEEFNEGAARMVKKISEGEAATREKLENEMGITFNEVDSAAFQAAIAPIYEDMKDVTPGLYDRFQEIIAEMPEE
ncbi:MAG: C4-dicarboxylate TRAP transporter substrate-binding protein [Lachnospiraceae bacterium]|nr:C4-dicarboxylate TRAP transporter substrate-binding protein [Lachnospiraceae bacterium]